MGIALKEGRHLRPGEVYPNAALVNEAFVKQCFQGQNPIGRWFEKETGNGVTRDRFQVIGVVADARYRNMREPITPTAYVPFHSSGANNLKKSGTFVVRTSSANPLALASVLRREVPRARGEFRVSNLRTQTELVQQHTVRERMLAMLALFFATIAILLAAVGLYGVLDYNVLQRRREIGIRIAIGASAVDIAHRVTLQAFVMVVTGTIAGVVLSLLSSRYIETLLYGVKGNDPGMFAAPALIIVIAALLASVPAVLRAMRVDPVTMLRSE